MKRIIRKIFYLLLVVVLALIVIFFPKNILKKGSDNNTNTSPAATPAKPVVSNPELEARYENYIKDILRQFDKGEKPQIVYNKILSETVPDKYKNFHLDLVLVFSRLIKGGENSDQAEIEDALEKLNVLKEENKWMK